MVCFNHVDVDDDVEQLVSKYNKKKTTVVLFISSLTSLVRMNKKKNQSS
jgi:hypothetical protein